MRVVGWKKLAGRFDSSVRCLDGLLGEREVCPENCVEMLRDLRLVHG